MWKSGIPKWCEDLYCWSICTVYCLIVLLYMSSSLEVNNYNFVENQNMVLPHQRNLFQTPLTTFIYWTMYFQPLVTMKRKIRVIFVIIWCATLPSLWKKVFASNGYWIQHTRYFGFNMVDNWSHFTERLLFFVSPVPYITKIWLFHDGQSYHIEASSMICRANQWADFYMIGTSVIKELSRVQYEVETR